MKLLVAYDGSPASEAAVEEVLRRPWPPGSEVLLITVIERPLSLQPLHGEVYAPLVERYRTALREEATHRIQRCMERFSTRADLQVSHELRDGSAKQILLEVIRQWGADLVLAGSHGSSPLARLFLGSVCHTLVTHAPCNVEVVKAPVSPSD